jgi:hypothetical protein
MVHIRGMAFVAYCSGQAFGEADLAVDAAQ